MSVLFFSLNLGYALWVIKQIFYLVFLWQLREYRYDRMRAHLHTPVGKKLFRGKKEYTKWVLFFLTLIGIPCMWVAWWGDIVISIYKKERWHHPVYTIKAVVLIVGSSLVAIGLPLLTGTGSGFLLVATFIDRVMFFLIFIGVAVLGMMTSLWRWYLFYRARKRREQMSHIRVVGITGSFGKTSTKEYLVTLLQEKYRVACTKESKNSDTAIASFLLHELSPDTEVAVIEMGILKKGELKTICHMAQPDIGVITAIGNQHVELFGSQKNIQYAKYELIQSLPRNGYGIFATQTAGSEEMATWAERDGLEHVIRIGVSDIHVDKTHISCVWCMNRTPQYGITASLVGEQTASNLALAVSAAHRLGMNESTVKRALKKIRPVEETMKAYMNDDGVVWVDDTFNASKEGVLAGIEYMRLYKGKKILVVTPLIELGDEAAEVHVSLARKVKTICDMMVVTNSNYITVIQQELRGSDVRLIGPGESLDGVLDLVSSVADSVVVCEGKEAKRILRDYAGNLRVYDTEDTFPRAVSKRRS